jgi:hypothetical protein
MALFLDYEEAATCNDGGLLPNASSKLNPERRRRKQQEKPQRRACQSIYAPERPVHNEL